MNSPNSQTGAENCVICLDPASLCVCDSQPHTKLALQIVQDAVAEPEHVSVGREAFITLCKRAYAWGRHQSAGPADAGAWDAERIDNMILLLTADHNSGPNYVRGFELVREYMADRNDAEAFKRSHATDCDGGTNGK